MSPKLPSHNLLVGEQCSPSNTAKLVTPCGNMYVTTVYGVNSSCVFVSLGKAGNCASVTLGAIVDLLNIIINDRDNLLIALSKLTGYKCQGGQRSCVDILSTYILDNITKEEASYE